MPNATFATLQQVVRIITRAPRCKPLIQHHRPDSFVRNAGAANGRSVALGDQCGAVTLVSLVPPYKAVKFQALDRIASLFWPTDHAVIAGGHCSDTQSFVLQYYHVTRDDDDAYAEVCLTARLVPTYHHDIDCSYRFVVYHSSVATPSLLLLLASEP